MNGRLYEASITEITYGANSTKIDWSYTDSSNSLSGFILYKGIGSSLSCVDKVKIDEVFDHSKRTASINNRHYIPVKDTEYCWVVSAKTSQKGVVSSSDILSKTFHQLTWQPLDDVPFKGTASSYGSYGGFVVSPFNAIDGDPKTFWCSISVPSWHKIEFSSIKKISRITANVYYHTVTGNIEASTDGHTWTRIVDNFSTKDDAISGVDDS